MPPEADSLISYGSHSLSFLTPESLHFRPIRRFTEKIVFFGFVMPCRLASKPTNLSFDFESPATDGVVRLPSLFSTIFGSPPSITAVAELVVPKSIPKIFDISLFFIVYYLDLCPVPDRARSQFNTMLCYIVIYLV